MMKWKIRIRLGSAAEEGEILHMQANKEENLYSSKGLILKYVSRENFRNCGETLKCYWKVCSDEAIAQPNVCTWDRKETYFVISVKNISGEWGWEQRFFCSSSPSLLKTPLFLPPCLNSVCLVKANMNVVWKTFPSSPGRNHFCPDRF